MCLNTIQDSLKAIELNFLTQVEISLTSDQLTRLGQENEYCCSLAKFAGQIGSQQSAVSATKVCRLQIVFNPAFPLENLKLFRFECRGQIQVKYANQPLVDTANCEIYSQSLIGKKKARRMTNPLGLTKGCEHKGHNKNG